MGATGDHLTPEELKIMAEGSFRKFALEAHVAGCEKCSTELEALRQSNAKAPTA